MLLFSPLILLSLSEDDNDNSNNNNNSVNNQFYSNDRI